MRNWIPRGFFAALLAIALLIGRLLAGAPPVAAETSFVFSGEAAVNNTDDVAGIIFSSSAVEDAPAEQVELPAVEPPGLDSLNAADAFAFPEALVLINGDHLVDEGFTPIDLVLMADYCDEELVRMKGSKIEGVRTAADALLAMLHAAKDDGVTNWQISSGWRSVAYQQQMWDNQVYAYRKDGKTGSQARAATARYMARPGASEHHTGLAFDVTVPGEESFASTAQCDWLHENCWDYGFIIRYTDEKKAITGINAEPWHIRYVGLPHAQIMRDENLCLEEYLESIGR